MNLNKKLEKDADTYNIGSGSGYYNIEEGNENIARVLTEGQVFAKHYLGKGVISPICYGQDKGCPIMDEDSGTHSTKLSIKYALYVIDKKDNEVKLATFPYSVMKGIAGLQENPDYKFDLFPMPYDIRITYKREESPANMYKVDAIPKLMPVNEENRKKLDEKLAEITPEDFVQKMKDKQIKTHQESGIWLSPEQLEKNAKEWNKNINKENKETEPVTHYPTAEEEGISAEDIFPDEK
jgi:hypothetical protein